ncbi:PREDICTED: DNA-directed RNA [Prunus dulcis]|uniref:DNA-directed RNA polymerase subunit n=1 Tax=Prunus dulcis TaxID=3755 RepID=A0A5E4FT39_PRUDU|nr:PREDICTED: DNA-directed RNA [Prunus dulcis]
MDGLNVSDVNLQVQVHPSRSNNVRKAVLRELSSLLLRFNEKFQGVVLAYEFNIDKVPDILPSMHPYLYVRLKAKLLLFSPKPDMLLEGKVVKVRQESIHVIILGFSSAIITDKDIREEFQYKTKHGKDLFVSRSHKRHVIKAGTMIRLLVKSVDEETLCISGSLLPARTGSILWLDKHVENVSLTDGICRSNKRRRGNEEESVMQEPSRTSAEAYSIVDHYIKKSKKHRESATQKPSRSEAYSAISDHSIKKSKKHRESAMQEPSRSEAYSAISDNSIKKSKKHKTREES